MREGFRLFDLIEQAGGSVALDATESGEISLPSAFDRRQIREEPLLELAGAYFGRIPHVFQRPNTLLYSWLKRELAARGVRGILLTRYVWCDKWHAEARRMKDWAGVPFVEIDGGEDPAAEARTATRIQSLLEMLK
jgi:benzoyl-CoA reductase/2-hydroxyglutaryl-CoA dehydratase subunit BcrC/BadD/HgdB